MSDVNKLKQDIQALDARIDDLCREKQTLNREYRKLTKTEELVNDRFVIYRRWNDDHREPIKDPFVVYQGEPGAFSEMAAINYFGKGVKTKGLYSFEDNFKALRWGEADYAVLPIENSSTGAIRQVYDLLGQYACFMVGETTVKVNQSLMVLPGTKMEDITTVYSHEQGLFQCEQFLNQHRDWRQVPQADTAGSAKMVAEMGDPHIAAICSSRAAEIYGLEVLIPVVNYNACNTTRFVVISPRMEFREGRDKVCISFKAPHESGSLFEILSLFKTNHLNLVKLESRPVIGRNWEYMFFMEFTGDLQAEGMDIIMQQLVDATSDLRVYGNFPSNLE
ncbi:MAG: prephenate dehydratase [Lachnospiraceae bacterium]|nr:prephenate dehydratase [Lachnospiraceae bacterium]